MTGRQSPFMGADVVPMGPPPAGRTRGRSITLDAGPDREALRRQNRNEILRQISGQ